jgi:hypothetical protein
MASGQEDESRVFRFTHAVSERDAQEIATVIRSMGDIRQASIDAERKALIVRGTANQIALAGWLFNQLDESTSVQPQQATVAHEFRLAEGQENVVRVFYPAHADTILELQEIATAVRAIAEIRRVFTYNALRAIAVRSTPEQMLFAEWLIKQLDTPAVGASAEYRISSSGDDVACVLYLTGAQSTEELQEFNTMLRALGDTRWTFTYGKAKAVMLRGTPDQIGLARWFLDELYRSTPRERVPREPATHEYPLPSGGHDVVRIFYLAHAATVQRLQEIATQVRTEAKIPRAFTFTARTALALRGTAEQIALADRLVGERDK